MKKNGNTRGFGHGIMYLCGLIVMMLGLLILFLIAIPPFAAFIDIPSFVFNTALIIGQVIAVSGVKSLVSGLNAAFSRRYFLTEEERLSSVALFKLMSRASIRAGIIGGLGGFLSLLNNMNEPSKLGPYISLSLICLYYGIIFSFLFFEPIAYILERRKICGDAIVESYNADTSANELSDKDIILALTRVCNQNDITIYDLLNADKITISHRKNYNM